MRAEGVAAPSGELSLRVIRGTKPLYPPKELNLAEILAFGAPQAGLSERINVWRRSNMRHLWRGAKKVLTARALGLPHFYGSLSLRVLRGNGDIEELGLVSLRLVTNNGVAFIVDGFQNIVELEIMKFHAVGTGSTAEAAGDAALVTEWVGADYTGGVRATGSTVEGAANIYRTIGTNTKANAGDSILREHGILSQAALGGGVLLDRTVFAAITLSQNDALQATYDFTINAGN
jgi:hypothetical protein